MLRDRHLISVKVDDEGLKTRNRELALLLELSNLLAASFSLKGILGESLSRVLEYFGLQAGRIYLKDEGDDEMTLMAHCGLDIGGLEKVGVNTGFSGKAVQTRSFIAQHVSDLEDKKRAALLFTKGLHTILCTPLITRDKVLGVMNLASDKTFTLKQDHIDLLIAIGNQIAVAVDNARLYDDLDAKVKELTEKKDMIKFFAYSVSHDLKSPAISLYGLTKRLYEKSGPLLDEKGKACCDHILRSAADLLALVETINAYVSAQEAPLNFEKLNVSDMAETIRSDFSAELVQRQIRWRAIHLPEIVGDRMGLMRVFRNFVDNALKYGGAGLSEIRISHREDACHHIFSFANDGKGIALEDREHLFQVFKRSKSTAGIAGSGLGLSIVKEIVERHGGCVWLDEDSTKGPVFHVAISKNLKTDNASTQKNAEDERRIK
ncbi:MAG: GAF domain-containing sensor histidine kinase [Deltaproteobacteria bacterium]|nr:GAF domain-containing sensor histidine kinase [Deltaproteobacteria bacterium]